MSQRSSPRRASNSVAFSNSVQERFITTRSPDGKQDSEVLQLGLPSREGSPLGNPWLVDHPALRQLSTLNFSRKKSSNKTSSGVKVFQKEFRLPADPTDGYRATSISPIGKYSVLPHIRDEAHGWTDVSYATSRQQRVNHVTSASTEFEDYAERGAVWDLDQHIQSGHTTDLPPVPSKTVKVYLCSGYTDMHEERFAIHKTVVPKLRTYCRSLGLDFELLDLHLGKSADLAEELTTSAVNQHVINNCHVTSLATSFLALVGNKYGSAIFPPHIDASEYDSLMLNVDTECLPILDHWYRLDDNQVPPQYCLRLYECGADEPAEQMFLDTLWMVPELLYMAAFSAHQQDRLSLERTSYYKKSDFEEDIERGLLSVADASNKCAVYMRNLKGLHSAVNRNFEVAKEYLDVDEDYQTIEQGSYALLSQLRDTLIPAHVSKDSIRTYSVPWSSRGVHPSTQVEHKNYLYQLSMDVETDMRWSIQEAVTKLKKSPYQGLNSNAREILCHLHIANTKTAHAIERKSVLSEIKGYLRTALSLDMTPNSGHAPVVLYGPQGIGKCTVMALTHQRIPQWFGSDCVRITRFVGLTMKSSNLLDMLLSICEQIAANYDIHLPRDLDQKPIIKVAATFHKLLKRVSDHPNAYKKPLYIILSSLDSLSPLYNAHNPAWLPHTLPAHVYVLTCVTQREHALYTRMRTLIKKHDTFVRLDGMSAGAAGKLIDVYLAQHDRTLSEEQRQTLMNMSQQADFSPMYMQLILAQAKAWDSLYAPSDLQLGKTIALAIEHLFDELVEKHGQSFVAYALGYITVSKGGLTDTELEDVMSCNDTVLSDILAFSTPPRDVTVRVPSLLWQRLRYDLRDHVAQRMRDNKTLTGWAHDIYVKVAREKFMQPMWESKLHRGLLEIFSADTPIKRTLKLQHGSVPIIENADRQVTLQPLDVTNIRKLRVIPYHLQKIGSFEKIASRLKSHVLCNYDFISVKMRAVGLKELIEDYSSLERTDLELSAVRETLEGLWRFRGAGERVGALSTVLIEGLNPRLEQLSGLTSLVSQAKRAGSKRGTTRHSSVK